MKRKIGAAGRKLCLVSLAVSNVILAQAQTVSQNVGVGQQFVAAHAGPLRVGLNDEDLGNNEGQVSYSLARRAPTAEEWLAGGRRK